MKRFLLVLLTIVIFASVSGAQSIELSVNGINVGASQEEVLSKFGKPLSTTKRGENPCGNLKLTIHYPGVKIVLDDDGDGKTFTVVAIEVTSTKWEVAPGVRVGADSDTVRVRIGEASEPRKEGNVAEWPYSIPDGYAYLYFRNEKLVKAVWELNLC
jgi:hypothetical protein